MQPASIRLLSSLGGVQRPRPRTPTHPPPPHDDRRAPLGCRGEKLNPRFIHIYLSGECPLGRSTGPCQLACKSPAPVLDYLQYPHTKEGNVMAHDDKRLVFDTPAPSAELEAELAAAVEAEIGLDVLARFDGRSRGRRPSKPPLHFEVVRDLVP